MVQGVPLKSLFYRPNDSVLLSSMIEGGFKQYVGHGYGGAYEIMGDDMQVYFV